MPTQDLTSGNSSAEITLFVLVASMSRDPLGYPAFKLPDDRVVSREEARALLQHSGTPLFCTARAEGAVLSLEIRRIPESDMEAHLGHSEHQFEFFRTQMGLGHSQSESHGKYVIALNGPQGTLRIAVAELHAWLRDYFVPNNSLSIARPTSSLISQGLTAVIGVGPAASISIYPIS